MKYEQVSNEATDLFGKVVKEHFFYLDKVHFLLLFSNVKRISGGNVVLASIKVADDLERLLSSGSQITMEQEIDFVIIIDKNAWAVCDDTDKERILRHELRHIVVIYNDDVPVYKLRAHDYEDFSAEVTLNSDEPDWRERVVALTDELYAQQRDDKKDKQNTSPPDGVKVRRVVV